MKWRVTVNHNTPSESQRELTIAASVKVCWGQKGHQPGRVLLLRSSPILTTLVFIELHVILVSCDSLDHPPRAGKSQWFLAFLAATQIPVSELAWQTMFSNKQ